MRIRPAVSTDRDVCYEIAVTTGDSGRSAAHLHRYPDLVGEVYTGPYLTLEPAHCFVLVTDDDCVQGYAIGTADTQSFEQRALAEWWPKARERFAHVVDPTPADQTLLATLDRPGTSPADVTTAFPAHGHIDLLPGAQGRGAGRHLMDRLLDSFAQAGAHGVHLGVDPTNANALGFYERLGFVVLAASPDVVYVGRSLP